MLYIMHYAVHWVQYALQYTEYIMLYSILVHYEYAVQYCILHMLNKNNFVFKALRAFSKSSKATWTHKS